MTSQTDQASQGLVHKSSLGAQEGQVVPSNCGNAGGGLDGCGEEEAKSCGKTPNLLHCLSDRKDQVGRQWHQ